MNDDMTTKSNARSKRRIIAATATAALAAAALGGAAVAMLGGTISGVNLATGLATGQAKPCQSDPVNFDFVAPQWNGSSKAFTIKQISYSDISNACVSAGARLYLVVSDGNTTFLDTSLVPTGTSGTIDLQTPLNSNRASSTEVNYLVEN